MKKPAWDTDVGSQMWESGMKDEQIANEFGISVGAVTIYRKKRWEKTNMPRKKPATLAVSACR